MQHKRIITLVILAAVAGCTATSSTGRFGAETTPEADIYSDQLVRGGALYDRWWIVLDADAPKDDHPLWSQRPDTESNSRSGATTWRCKECHGWDYRGVAGAYGSGSHRTGFAGVAEAASKTEEQIVATILEGHGYAAVGLSEQDARDLARFINRGLIDTSTLIDANGKFTGSAEEGTSLFHDPIVGEDSCTDCHGEDGLESPWDDPEFDDFPGLVARKNPWELIHKVRFGQPGTEMPAVLRHLSSDQLADLGAYLQTLPEKPGD